MQNINVKACVKCRRIFQATVDTDNCPECNIILEQIYKNVRLYIRRNKLVGLHEVSEECNVSVRQLIKWVREERILFLESSGVGIPCLNCGISIRAGKYCIPCLKKIESIYVKPEESQKSEILVTQKNKMHHKYHFR